MAEATNEYDQSSSRDDDHDEIPIEEDKKDELDIDTDDDEDYQECIINPKNDRRVIICDSQNKHDDIIKCFGSLEVHFMPDSKIQQDESLHGTGTVIYIDNKNIIYVLTAAHNVRQRERKCAACGTTTLRRKCKNKTCDSNPSTERTGNLIQPQNIFFDRRGNGIGKRNDESGQSIERYEVVDYKIPNKYPANWDEFATPKGGFDICIISFKCHDKNGIQLYKKLCSKITLVNDETFGNNSSLYIYGYPGFKREVKNHRTYYYLYGMGTSKINEKNAFTVDENNVTKKKYIVNKGIDTTVGQSGSCIYSYDKNNEKRYLIYGIHTGGSPVKHCNYGTFLDTKTMEWIRNICGENMGNINKFIVSKKTKIPFQPQHISTSGAGSLLAQVVLSQTPTIVGNSYKKSSQTPTPTKHKNKLKCDLVKDETGLKVVKLFDEFEKYFTAVKGDNSKGLVVNGYVSDTFKCLGVGIGWQLTKFGGKNVSKTSFIWLKAQLNAEARSAKKSGYELTFINKNVPKTVPLKTISAPIETGSDNKFQNVTQDKKRMHSAKTHSVSTPNSPNNTTSGCSSNNIPNTVPLNPVSASVENNEDTKQQETMKPLNISKNVKGKGGYQPPKTCEMVEEINSSTKKVKLFQDYSKFFSAQGTKEFVVHKMTRNEYGKALSELGIAAGWKITECENKQIGNKLFAMLKNKISDAARKNRINGYVVVFENPNAQNIKKVVEISNAEKLTQREKLKSNVNVNDQKQNYTVTHKKSNSIEISPATTATITHSQAAATISTEDKTNESKADNSSTKIKKTKSGYVFKYETPKSCKLEQDNGDTKSIRMYQEFGKFFSVKSFDGNKGIAVGNMTRNEFGNALRELGIGEGWKIIQSGKRKLGNKLFAMLKNEIVSAANAQKHSTNGYVLVFENKNILKSPVSKPVKQTPKSTAMDFDDLKQEKKVNRELHKHKDLVEQKKQYVEHANIQKYNPLAEVNVALLGFHNKYLSAYQNGKIELNKQNIGESSIFKSTPILKGIQSQNDYRMKVCFKLNGADLYLSCEKNGKLSLKRWSRNWEEWIVEKEEKSGMFSFKSHHNTYLCAEKKAAVGNRKSKGDWEMWRIIVVQSDTKDQDEKKLESPKKIVNKKDTQSTSTENNLKCKLVKDDRLLKVVRLYASFDKYFVGVAGKDNKGLIINKLVDDGFLSMGVKKNWKLKKLGKENVENSSFKMLTNKLLVQSTIGKKEDGYEVTFSKW